MNNEQLIRQLIIWGVQWVSSERELHRRDGRPLTDVEWSALDGFFDRTTLDSVTIKWMPRLQNPPFYHELKNMNLQLIPFEDSDAITFRNTILFAEKGVRRDPPPRPLLFHELVHVVQYAMLGVETFVTRYAHGWFDHGQIYDQIPLESHAIELHRRYEAMPTASFSVVAEVQRRRGDY